LSTTHAVRCRACGGAVASRPGKTVASCLFCGAPSSDLVELVVDESIEDPTGFVPFTVDESKVNEAFQAFAKSSFWYPSDLRNSKLQLRRLLLPAWSASGTAETHWAGLVKASTASGKRPVSGSETLRFDQVLVPSSQSLTLAELTGLGRFDETDLQPFGDHVDEPHEVSEVTRTAAEKTAMAEIERRHRDAIARANGTVKLNGASLVTEFSARPVLVPVWIAAYKYGDKTFRVLVNGQSGALRGSAPKSVWKMLAVGIAIVTAVVVAGSCFVMCSGGAMLAGN
jgi:hypothetical protein